MMKSPSRTSLATGSLGSPEQSEGASPTDAGCDTRQAPRRCECHCPRPQLITAPKNRRLRSRAPVWLEAQARMRRRP
eukprot:402451-Alexandrium_andersonii.AAC.1